jgi:hypothetical protein
MKLLTFAGSEAIEVGVWLEHPFEHGCIMSIDYELEEVHVYDGREGWTLSSANGNLAPLKFVESNQPAWKSWNWPYWNAPKGK